MKWNIGEPPNDGRSYFIMFKSGIICSGRLRYGMYGEPDQNQLAYRCDCCGKFATPFKWSEIDYGLRC